VTLRHLQVQGHPASPSGLGINAQNFSVLHIESCTVRAPSTGLFFLPNSADGTPNRKLFVKDSIFRNNGGGGIFLANAADTGTLIATIERTRMENNSSGGGGSFRFAKVTLRECLVSGNAFTGILAQEGSEVNVESCVSTYNGNHGMAAFDGGIMRVSNSTASNNTQFGFNSDPSSTFESRGNSTVRGNTLGNTSGTITPIIGT